MKNQENMLDIIIVNYNSTDYLLRCLQSILRDLNGIHAKVYVQDNASRDGVGRVESRFPQVVLTRNRCNIGFAGAINQALKKTTAPYVFILNPDTAVMDGCLDGLIRLMKENPDVGIVGPRIFEPDGEVQGSARSFPTPLTALFGRSSLLTRLFPNNRITRANILTTGCDGRTPMEVGWVSGAALMVRRKAFQDVGLMDERFFIYWEDADWCRRMWDNGWKVVYYPEPSVVHYVGGSSEKSIARSVLEFHKSCYLLFKKYVRFPVSVLNPVAFSGLILRFFFVLASHGVIWGIRTVGGTRREERPLPAEGAKGRVKIVRIIARLNIGGPAIHVYLLTKGLNDGRFESVLVTGTISPQEGDMSYLFDSFHIKPMFIPELQREISLMMDLKALFEVSKILRREKPDIVHTHTAKAGSSARLAALLYNLVSGKKVRMVHTFHGHVFEGYFGRAKSAIFVLIERLLARGTDAIIAISKTQKEELSEKFRIAPKEKIKTIQLGFDLKPFLNSKNLKGRFREHLKVHEDTFLVGIVGRLVPIKNHIMFLRAAKLFITHHPSVSVQFVVIGDGELREELEKFCEIQGLERHVRFCGWIRDVPSAYADLDVLALTSQNEGTPVSIIEAMASSVPVIATDAGGVKDLLGSRNGLPSRDGFAVCERGVLCRRNDPHGFEKGLTYLINTEDKEREERLFQARTFVERRYSEERLLRDMKNTYLDLVGVPERSGSERILNPEGAGPHRLRVLREGG